MINIVNCKSGRAISAQTGLRAMAGLTAEAPTSRQVRRRLRREIQTTDPEKSWKSTSRTGSACSAADPRVTCRKDASNSSSSNISMAWATCWPRLYARSMAAGATSFTVSLVLFATKCFVFKVRAAAFVEVNVCAIFHANSTFMMEIQFNRIFDLLSIPLILHDWYSR